VGRHSQSRSWKISRCSANDDVDLTECFANSPNRVRKRFIIAHVCRKPLCLPSCGNDSLCSIVELFLSPSNQTDTGTLLGESFRNREIDSASSTGDDGNFAFKYSLSERRAHFCLRLDLRLR